MDFDDGSFNFYGQPMKQVRFFYGFVTGVALSVFLAAFIALGNLIFPRSSSRFSEMVFLMVLGLFCGKLSINAEKLKDLEFWEGWGMLLGIFTAVVVAQNIALEPMLKSGTMSICFVFGRWLGIEKIKRQRRT